MRLINLWSRILKNCIISLGKQDFADIISKKMFFLGDTDGSKSLSLAEVRRVLKQMHVEVPDLKV